MNSIKELTDLEYSLKLSNETLHNWIINNNYLSDLQTEYFQILCKNCNAAKGMIKNKNECPMKNTTLTITNMI